MAMAGDPSRGSGARRGAGAPPPISFRGRALGFFAYLVARAFGLTLRWTVLGKENIAAAKSAGRVCWASWHGRQLLTINVHAGQRVVILASLSRDGDIQAAMLGRLGYRVERGSSSRGAARGLLSMARAMREGWEPAIAVDGPRGPREGVKQGIVALARYEDASIIPTMASCVSAWIVPSWDRTMIPKPFTRAVIEYAPPVRVPTGTSDEELEVLRAGIEATLREMTRRADRHFGDTQVARLAAAFARADAREAARKARKASAADGAAAGPGAESE
jgi:lysophospholipid acyltransferase (LPLAT)-like uncharacterized protein